MTALQLKNRLNDLPLRKHLRMFWSGERLIDKATRKEVDINSIYKVSVMSLRNLAYTFYFKDEDDEYYAMCINNTTSYKVILKYSVLLNKTLKLVDQPRGSRKVILLYMNKHSFRVWHQYDTLKIEYKNNLKFISSDYIPFDFRIPDVNVGYSIHSCTSFFKRPFSEDELRGLVHELISAKIMDPKAELVSAEHCVKKVTHSMNETEYYMNLVDNHGTEYTLQPRRSYPKYYIKYESDGEYDYC